MTTLSQTGKKEKILAHEEMLARRLARRIIEKPVPPVWMILVPVFFVFHAWKIKQYSNGLKDFTENYLTSRRRALDFAVLKDKTADKAVEELIEIATDLPADARSQYRELMTCLVEHYRCLLKVDGKDYGALIRAHYRKKSNYLIYCVLLNKLENELNIALLPKIEGDRQDLRDVVDKMKHVSSKLYRQDVAEMFG